MFDEDFSKAQAAVLDRYGVAAEQRWTDAPVVGGRAHALVTGDGPPVVMLNGIGTPAAMWAPLMARLHGVTLYAVDLPGYGLTDTTADFAAELRPNAVQFLTEVLDGFGLDRPIVIGNSLGSLWSSWLAIEHPARIAALVHVGCPAIVLETSAPLPMRLLGVRPLGRLMTRIRPPSARQVEQLARIVNEHPLPPEIASLLLATERLDHFQDTFLATLNQLVRPRGSRPEMVLGVAELAGIQTPTLLVFARNDPMGAASVGRRVADAMPIAQLHVVDGGHVPWIHHADQVAAPIMPHLQRASRARDVQP